MFFNQARLLIFFFFLFSYRRAEVYRIAHRVLRHKKRAIVLRKKETAAVVPFDGSPGVFWSGLIFMRRGGRARPQLSSFKRRLSILLPPLGFSSLPYVARRSPFLFQKPHLIRHQSAQKVNTGDMRGGIHTSLAVIKKLFFLSFLLTLLSCKVSANNKW